jgi:tetratricopeptide (TPR) repeat protein
MIERILALFVRPPDEAGVVVENDDQHNAVFERGADLISPHISLLDRQPKVTDKARSDIRQGIAFLNSVTNYNPQNWAAYWFKGKGYQTLNDHKNANTEFKASFSLQRENPDVAREYTASCLEIGEASEAVNAAKHAIQLNSNDAGLYANLAIAFLISGENDEAKRSIEKSIEMAPDDEISKHVHQIVQEVVVGKRKQPKTMSDLLMS